MHLQCFTPTLYVMGVATRTYKRDDHYPICTKLHYGCLLALCGPTMHVATLYMWSFPGQVENTESGNGNGNSEKVVRRTYV